MIRIFAAWLAVASMASGLAWAEPSATMQQEVASLLGRLSTSSCTFYRNGSWHDAASARGHLEKKYRYLVKKDLVKSAEDFIRLGGTESSTSHEPYQVKCGEQVSSSREWLTRTLGEIRLSR